MLCSDDEQPVHRGMWASGYNLPDQANSNFDCFMNHAKQRGSCVWEARTQHSVIKEHIEHLHTCLSQDLFGKALEIIIMP